MGKFWVIALCALYILSPVDFVPDVIPLAGWADDGGALLAAIAAAMSKGKK